MKNINTLLFSCILIFMGCSMKNTIVSNELKTIVKQLKISNSDTGGDLLRQLRDYAENGLSKAEGIYLLREAANQFPPHKIFDISQDLVYAADNSPSDDYISVIHDNFDKYNPRTQSAAIRLLAKLESKDAAKACIDLLDKSSKDMELYSLGSLTQNPRHINIFFPKILNHINNEKIQGIILEFILACFENDKIVDNNVKNEISNILIKIIGKHKELIFSAQNEEGISWMWEDNYIDKRFLLGLLLDILGYVDTLEAKHILNEYLNVYDPRLKMFALLGLIKYGEIPKESYIIDVVKSSECRYWFFSNLLELDKEYLIPKEYYTQEKIAESNMVNWLTYPTELGQPPDEIELMKTVSVNDSGEIYDYYLYRFKTNKPHWAAEDGWMAGISGGFPRSQSPTISSNGSTFSNFTKWDERTPQEHIEDIIGIIEEWREKKP